MSEAPPGRRRWLVPALLGLTALAVLVGRVLWDSRAAYLGAAAAEARGDRVEAVRGYLDAARLYAPGSPYVRHALDALQDLAAGAEKTGDRAAARQALEAIRAALLATRSFYTPYAERLPDVEARLARIYGETESEKVAPGASLEARRAWHASRLGHHPGPATLPVLLAFLGLALWLGALVGFLTRGLDGTLRLRRAPAVLAALVFVVGFTLFLAALRLA